MLSKNIPVDVAPYSQMTILAPPYVAALSVPLPASPSSTPSSSSFPVPVTLPYVIVSASHKGKMSSSMSSSVGTSSGSKARPGPRVLFSYLYHEGGKAVPFEGKLREPLSFKFQDGKQQSQGEDGGRKGSTKLTSLFAPLSSAGPSSPQKGGTSPKAGALDRDKSGAQKSVYVTCLKFSTDRETETPLIEENYNDRGVVLGVALSFHPGSKPTPSSSYTMQPHTLVLMGLTTGAVVVHNLSQSQTLHLLQNGRLAIYDVRLALKHSLAKVVASSSGFASWSPCRVGVVVEGGEEGGVVRIWSFERIVVDIVDKGKGGGGGGGTGTSASREILLAASRDSVNSQGSLGSSPSNGGTLGSQGTLNGSTGIRSPPGSNANTLNSNSLTAMNSATKSTVSSKSSYGTSYKTQSTTTVNTGTAGGTISLLRSLVVGRKVRAIRWRPLVEPNIKALKVAEPSPCNLEFVLLVSTRSTTALREEGGGECMVWNVSRRHMPVSILPGGGEWNWLSAYSSSVRAFKGSSTRRTVVDYQRIGDLGTVVGLNNEGVVSVKNVGKGSKMTRQIPSSIIGFSGLGSVVSVMQRPPNGEGGDEGILMGGGKGGGWNMEDVDVEVQVTPTDGDNSKKLIKLYELGGKESCETNARVCGEMGDEHMGKCWMVVARVMEEGWDDEFVEDTLVDILSEIGDLGDVVGVVTMCEVVGIWGRKGVVKKLSILRVREWYLSYLSLLRTLCLNTLAASIIKFSPDPVISSLSRASTDVNNSCPSCLKPVLLDQVSASSSSGRVLRSCSSCKKKVALCALCHDPVRLLCQYCAGCGHSMHLECAMEWWREGNKVCPTGCGHECRKRGGECVWSFPREVQGDYCRKITSC
ncbi:hypothetical protein TrCOL_g10613 [Triparma columacea]|uniref:RING-type domain-containing protein n=1 Tax=Triparma columacea TaxID=722753 RepID=A0A9W7LBJ8_9STRA|nr:hypothetical protein TrCOL_g10613 [Triparma columacea]